MFIYHPNIRVVYLIKSTISSYNSAILKEISISIILMKVGWNYIYIVSFIQLLDKSRIVKDRITKTKNEEMNICMYLCKAETSNKLVPWNELINKSTKTFRVYVGSKKKKIRVQITQVRFSSVLKFEKNLLYIDWLILYFFQNSYIIESI